MKHIMNDYYNPRYVKQDAKPVSDKDLEAQSEAAARAFDEWSRRLEEKREFDTGVKRKPNLRR